MELMKKIINLLLFFLPVLLHAQINQEVRKEFDLKDDEHISGALPIGARGLITYGTNNVKGAPDGFVISVYSTDIEKERSLEFESPTRVTARRILFDEDTSNLYFIFGTKKEWKIRQFVIDDNKLVEKDVKRVEPFFQLQYTVVIGNKLYAIGILKKIPTLMIMDLTSGTQEFSTLPGTNRKRSVESVSLDNKRENLLVFYRDGKDMKQSEMNLLFIDLDGNFGRNLSLDKNPDFSIIDGYVTWIDEESFILAGNYGKRGKSILSSGIYFSKWINGEQAFMTYHSFTDFENFFSYLPQRTQAKIERRKSRKKNRGLEDFIQTYVALHPVISMKDGYRVVGEVYYPTYRTETYTTYVNGKPTTSTRQVFDGYQYSHAAVLDVSESGEKVKDYCFSMFLVNKPFSVIRNLRITTDTDGNSKMIYSTGAQLKATTIIDGVMHEVDYGNITSELDGDKVRSTGFTTCSYWYDQYYIVYGTQYIKNKENSNVAKRRSVFFLSKISYTE